MRTGSTTRVSTDSTSTAMYRAATTTGCLIDQRVRNVFIGRTARLTWG